MAEVERDNRIGTSQSTIQATLAVSTQVAFTLNKKKQPHLVSKGEVS